MDQDLERIRSKIMARLIALRNEQTELLAALSELAERERNREQNIRIQASALRDMVA